MNAARVNQGAFAGTHWQAVWQSERARVAARRLGKWVAFLAALLLGVALVGTGITARRPADAGHHEVAGTVTRFNPHLGYVIVEHEGQKSIYLVEEDVMESLHGGNVEGRQAVVHYQRDFGSNVVSRVVVE